MFQLSKTPNLLFGSESWKKLTSVASIFGKKILIITGGSSFDSGKYGPVILDMFKGENFIVERKYIKNEPLIQDIDNIVELYRKKEIDVIISIGGGSVIDAGKAISAMLKEEGSIKLYLEGVGHKQPSGDKLPFIAMPTTAGTGSEATKNAVVSNTGSDAFKKSLRHNNYIPNYAIISPELAIACPENITAASGMDALTQLIESFLSTQSNTYTDLMALNGIERVLKNLEKAVFEGGSIEAREQMGFAAYLSGITLANAGLGAVHGFAQPLGSLFSIPHGVVCGTLMGATNKITLEKAIAEDNMALIEKMALIGRLISNEEHPTDLAIRFVDYIMELTERLQMPKLGLFGILPSDFESIITITGLKNHPLQLDENDLMRILQERL